MNIGDTKWINGRLYAYCWDTLDGFHWEFVKLNEDGTVRRVNEAKTETAPKPKSRAQLMVEELDK